MDNIPFWAFEIAHQIYKTDVDTPELDLMAPPYCFDADTAIYVYEALEYLHNDEKMDLDKDRPA